MQIQNKQNCFWNGLVHSWEDPTGDQPWMFLQLLVERREDQPKLWFVFTQEMQSLSQIFSWDPLVWSS